MHGVLTKPEDLADAVTGRAGGEDMRSAIRNSVHAPRHGQCVAVRVAPTWTVTV